LRDLKDKTKICSVADLRLLIAAFHLSIESAQSIWRIICRLLLPWRISIIGEIAVVSAGKEERSGILSGGSHTKKNSSARIAVGPSGGGGR
jgi:hypothetical protein